MKFSNLHTLRVHPLQLILFFSFPKKHTCEIEYDIPKCDFLTYISKQA